MDTDLTLVSIAWRKRRRNHRLLFGTPVRWVRLDWHRRLAAFKSGDIFAYERWQGSQFGTSDWRIFVLQTAHSGQYASEVSGIFPGAIVLVKISGKDRCKRFLKLLDALKTNRDLSEYSAGKWRQISLLFEMTRDAKTLFELVRAA